MRDPLRGILFRGIEPPLLREVRWWRLRLGRDFGWGDPNWEDPNWEDPIRGDSQDVVLIDGAYMLGIMKYGDERGSQLSQRTDHSDDTTRETIERKR